MNIGEPQSTSDAKTQLSLVIRFCCEDGEPRTIIYKAPMSEFMNDDKTYKKVFNKFFKQYLKISVLFLHGSTPEQRNDVRYAIDKKEYILSGLVHDGEGGLTTEYIYDDTEEYLAEYVEEVIQENGGYNICREVEFEFTFPVLAISSNTSIVSPYQRRRRSNETTIATSHQGSEVTPNVTSAVVTPTSCTSMSPHQGSANTSPFETPSVSTNVSHQGSEESKEQHIVETVSDEPTPPKYNANWRDSPMPNGPWRHKSVQRHVTFGQQNSSDIPHTHDPSIPQVQQNINIPNTSYISQGQGQGHQGSFNPTHQPNGFQPITPQYAVNSPYHPVPPSYQYSPVQYPIPVHNQMQLPNAFIPTRNTFDISEFGIMSKDRYCAQINRMTFDTKTFLKKEYVPSQGTSSLLNWYRRFTAHALRCGIFVPPFESLLPLNILGAWSDGLDPRVTDNISLMSQMIHSAIINFQAIPTGADFTSILRVGPNGANSSVSVSAVLDFDRNVVTWHKYPKDNLVSETVENRPVCLRLSTVSKIYISYE